METSESLAERLGNVSHFKKLPLKDRLAITLSGQMHLYSPGTTIFSEDDPCAGMYVLLKGHVHICKHGLQGQLSIIAEIDPVIMFNEVALLDGGVNPFTAIATENCFCWNISYQSFQNLLKRYAKEQFMQIPIGLLKIMASRYRQLLESFSDITFLSVPSRVAKLIFELSNQGQTSINRREQSIQEMAAHIATTPEAISRSLNILKCQNIISSTRLTITILDPDKLEKLAHAELHNLFVYGSKNQ
jgi:CRP/FNR family transcriptional regulator, cyclic AMP receptor protein